MAPVRRKPLLEAQTKWPPFSRRHIHAFSWMNMFQFRLKFHWSLFARVQLTIIQHRLVDAMPLSAPMMVSLPMHICVTRSQWVNQWWIIVNWLLRNKFCSISSKMQELTFKKIHLNMSSSKWRPFCSGLIVLKDMMMESYYNPFFI